MTKMKNYILASGFLLMLASCKKEMLNTGPTGSADEAAIYTTTSNAANSINGIYRYLYSRYSNQNQPGQGGGMLQLDFMRISISQPPPGIPLPVAEPVAGSVRRTMPADMWNIHSGYITVASVMPMR